MRSQFASGRPQLPFSSSNVTVSSGGSITTAKTLYFAIQGENPAGVNLLSTLVGPITIGTGQQMVIAIPALARGDGEWWQSFVISASLVNDPTTFVQIGKVNNYTLGGALVALPASLAFSTDEHLALSKSVDTPADLPAAPLEGQMRGVNSLGYVYEYQSLNSLSANDTSILAATTGRWVRRGSFSTYVAATTDPGGCDRDIRSLDPQGVMVPQYGLSGLGAALRFWIYNDGLSAEPAGKRVGLTVGFGDEPKSALFRNLLKLTFQGYPTVSTGALRTVATDLTTFPLLGQQLNFQAQKSNLVLPDDLQPGEAYAIDVVPDFTASDLDNQVPNNTTISVYPFLYAQAGEYSEAGAIIGDVIYPDGDQCLIFPTTGLSVKRLGGAGMVDFYSFLKSGPDLVSSLTANINGQTITINGDGTTQKRTAPIPDAEAIRAIVGTLDGAGVSSAFSANVTVAAGGSLTLGCTYPASIRADYPDTRLAGRSDGDFNATGITFYVKRMSDGQIRAFSANSIVAGSTTGTFYITSWSSGTVITTVPTPADPSFGFWAPPVTTPTPVTGATDFTAGSYQIAGAFSYSDTVTTITHDEGQGCILTASSTFATMQARTNHWAEAVSNQTALAAVAKANVTAYQVRYVTSDRFPFRFDPNSTDNSANSVRPTWVDVGSAGRWLVDYPQFTASTTTGAPGSSASVVLGGTLIAPTLTFSIPQGVQGVKGDPPSISATATTVAYGTPASVSITGTAAAPIFDFFIPQGAPGSGGGGGSAPSSYPWILFDQQGTLPGTGTTQFAIFSDGALKLRLPNNGGAYQLAVIESAAQNNLLLNGSFQIAQTGTSWSLTSGTTFAHLADHWQGSVGTSGAATVTQNTVNSGSSYFLRWQQTSGASDTPILRTRLENAATLAGMVCTVSFNAVATAALTVGAALIQSFGSGGSPSSSVSTLGGSFNVTTTKQRFSFTVILPSVSSATFGTNGDSSLDLAFTFPVSSTFQIDLDSIKLEPGALATPFLPKPIDQLLPSLYRYLYRISGTSTSLPSFATGRALAANTGTVFVPFPTRMRTLPTLTSNDLLLNANAVTAAAIATNGAGLNGATVELSATVTAAQSCLARLNSAASFVQFDARMPLT